MGWRRWRCRPRRTWLGVAFKPAAAEFVEDRPETALIKVGGNSGTVSKFGNPRICSLSPNYLPPYQFLDARNYNSRCNESPRGDSQWRLLLEQRCSCYFSRF